MYKGMLYKFNPGNVGAYVNNTKVPKFDIHPDFTERNDVYSECYGKAIKLTAYKSTTRYPRSVQKFNSDKQKQSLHPTQKPVELCKYLIKTYTNKGDTVLDFAMGSGTTGVACVDTDRSFIVMNIL